MQGHISTIMIGGEIAVAMGSLVKGDENFDAKVCIPT